MKMKVRGPAAGTVNYNRWISYLNLSKDSFATKFYVISSEISCLGLFASPMKSVFQNFFLLQSEGLLQHKSGITAYSGFCVNQWPILFSFIIWSKSSRFDNILTDFSSFVFNEKQYRKSDKIKSINCPYMLIVNNLFN